MMLETATRYDHINLNANGVPVIVGTNFKVVMLVMAQQAHGYSAEGLHFQYPQLSMGQVHSALAYYWDHQTEMDVAIEHSLEEANRLREAIPESKVQAKLRKLKHGTA